LAVRQAEEALLDDRVPAVPEREREAEQLVVVRDAGEAVLSPPVRPRSRLIVAEMIPGVARVAVVLANGSPLAFAEIRSPLAPPTPCVACFGQALGLGQRGLHGAHCRLLQ